MSLLKNESNITLFILTKKKKKSLPLVGLVKGYIYNIS